MSYFVSTLKIQSRFEIAWPIGTRLCWNGHPSMDDPLLESRIRFEQYSRSFSINAYIIMH